MTAPTASTLSRRTKSKPRASHYYWADAGDFAVGLGVQLRFFCGRWGWAPRTDRSLVMLAGGALTDEAYAPRDCKACLRSLEATRRKAGVR